MDVFVREWSKEDYSQDYRNTRSHIVGMVQDYKSLIWTERFQEVGEFQLDLPLNLENRRLLRPGVWLEIANSHRLMRVLTQSIQKDSDGEYWLRVTGDSLEGIFKDLWAMSTEASPRYTGASYWKVYIENSPNEFVERYVFDQTNWQYVSGKDPGPKSSFARARALNFEPPSGVKGVYYPLDTILPSTQDISDKTTPEPLINVIENMAKSYGFGFRITKNPDTSLLHFDTYNGSYKNGKDTLIMFSEEEGSWVTSSEIEDYTEYRSQVVSWVDRRRSIYPSQNFGWDVREEHIFYDVGDDDLSSSERDAISIGRGEAEYNKRKPKKLIEGNVTHTHGYKYEEDYFLGDLVTVKTMFGSVEDFRVTEQIFISDAEGVKSYPTLTIEESIIPGVWLDPRYDADWATYSTAQYWQNQP